MQLISRKNGRLMRAQATRKALAPACRYTSSADAVSAVKAMFGPPVEVGTNYPRDRRARLADAITEAWNDCTYGYYMAWAEKGHRIAQAVKSCIEDHLEGDWDQDPDSIY